MRNNYISVCLIVFAIFPLQVLANDVAIEAVRATYTNPGWSFDVTLRHDDEGWDHYADAWRVVGPDGKEYATRTLFHPHDNEQPFTRSLGNVQIPANIDTIYIEAHDKVHGWSSEKFTVKLSK
ncbi:MAG: hypothetical protein ACC707_16600 [Thiohalomonadales bacterium]